MKVSSFTQVAKAVKTDYNIQALRLFLTTQHPGATKRYLISKAPIVEWITRYSLQWLGNDVLAGLTIGVLVVPQSLAYAKVANIDARYGLISSWLPPLFYAIMGTSKDVTAGPTAIMGLLTGQIVSNLVNDGYNASAVASACAFWTGIYSIVLGLFRLGFLLDFIPIPVLSGYVSGAAITILLQQLKNLFGQPSTGNSTAIMIGDFLTQLPQTNWRAFIMGITGIIALVTLQYIGRTVGARCRPVWFFCVARNAIVLVVFTCVSWAVNRHLSDPLFSISKVTGSGLPAPTVLAHSLLVRTAGPSVAVFLAAALEHLAIGKAFARRHGYTIAEDQELTYIGVVNLFGSFFGCMPVTGGFSRTAVNAESGVKSPLSGLMTSACVLISIFKLADAFYWIPSATLSAIVMVAVAQIVLPTRIFVEYWRTSLADFVASMISLWVTIWVSVEVGIACAVGFSIVYVLLQLAFAPVTLVTQRNADRLLFSHMAPQGSECEDQCSLPEDALVFVLESPVLFPNAARICRTICDTIYTRTAASNEEVLFGSKSHSDRLWNDTRRKHVRSLRRAAGLSGTDESQLPRLRLVVIEMTRVSHVDTTGLQFFADIRAAVQEWAGEEAEVVFVGLNERVKARFTRAKGIYELSTRDTGVQDNGSVVFEVLQGKLQKETMKTDPADGKDITV
ncbi:hypothetical protein N0V93_000966 [Gnomoniopsis smithogilvyi]|uniref:STAS domain-containing protein n=1 Tax=Gnomoniopsis smithogilvyi TaxID=1191159 RepID=A0A9W8Z177_9PEZI|nr:hypothetical protein N0V93_000966 [Gnomoniopsis smithogilvyi]